MRSALTALRRRASRQAGFTLIEVLVVTALLSVVVGVPLTFLAVSSHRQNEITSRATASTQGEQVLERLVRDLRLALPTSNATLTWGNGSASATMTQLVPGTAGASTQTVVWSCTYGGACTRRVNSGTAVQVVPRITSLAFSPEAANGTVTAQPAAGSTATATNPTYVGLTFVVPATSEDDSTRSHSATNVGDITLQDGVTLRSRS